MKDFRQANRGLGLEQMVRLSLRAYETYCHTSVLFHKVPTAWLPLRDGFGRVVSAKVQEKAGVDFLGVYRGQAIAFDCKECRGARIRWDRVEPHQVDFLENWEAAGGMSFVLVGFPGLCLLVPWPLWRAGLEGRGPKGRASATGKELTEAGAIPVQPAFGGRVPLDFLAAIDQLLRQRHQDAG